MDPRDTQIILIQEPWINPQGRKTKSKRGYHQILPKEGHPRVAILVSENLDSTKWEPVYHQTSDMISVRITTTQGKTTLHNCYHPSGPHSDTTTGTLPHVKAALEREAEHDLKCEQILAGDFNMHHPHWGSHLAPTQHRMADTLIETAGAAGLQLSLPAGTVTWEKQNCSCQTIDLVFVSEGLRQRLVECRTEPDATHGSDHIPIITTIDNEQPRMRKTQPRPQYKKAKWDVVRTVLATELDAIEETTLQTHEEIDAMAEAVQRAIQITVEKVVPKARPSPHAKQSWTPECQRLIRLTRRQRREWREDRSEERHRAYLATCHARNKQIRRDTNLAWRKVVKDLTDDPTKIWKLAKWARNDDGKPKPLPQFPTLVGPSGPGPHDGRTDIGKANILAAHFFPEPRDADLSDIPNTAVPEPFQMLQEVTEEEILKALKWLPANKAPGPDQIPNEFLKQCREVLAKPLATLYSACLHKEYHPKPFKQSITVVLRKPQKPDYTRAGAYRPIALLNTLAKTLEAIVARRMSQEAENRGLLPDEQMGGRPGRSTTTALDMVTEKVRTVWKTDKKAVVSMLCLDISGAFDNVSHQRLLHNLQMKGFPPQLVGYIRSFLEGRSTQLKLGEFLDEPRPQRTGIPQGSTLSPILFLFFASTLLPLLRGTRITPMGYVDDSNIVVSSRSTETNCRMLENAHQQCIEWARKHGAAFAPQKYQLIHFTRGRSHNMQATVQIPGFEDGPVPSLRLLGVQVDSKLRWGPHIKKAAEKGVQQMAAIQRLSKSTWGASFTKARHIYTAVIRPTMTYGCQSWTNPQGKASHARRLVEPIEKVQSQALRHITGAYKSVPAVTLQKEAEIPPIQLYTQELTRQSVQANWDKPAYQFIRKRCDEIAKEMTVKRRHKAKAKAYTRHEGILEAVRDQDNRITEKSRTWWMDREWKKGWQAERGKRTEGRATIPSTWTAGPKETGRSLHRGLSRPTSTMITLIKTEHIGLNAYLTRQRVPGATPECQCNYRAQTLKHVCIQCPLRQSTRNALFAAAGSTDWKEITNTKRGLLATAKWLIREGVLDQFSLAREEEIAEGEKRQGGIGSW